MESTKSSIDTELVKEFWRRQAQQEDNRWTPKLFLTFEMETVSKFLDNQRKLSILDLGCGSGSLSRYLTKPGDTLTAVDFEPSFERFFLQDPRFRFICCEVDKFTSTEKYDLLLLFGVVTHLNTHKEDVTYKKISSMTNEDGIVIVKNQCSDSDEFIFNGFSKDLDAHYSARYPNIFEQRDKLLKYFPQVEMLQYPSWSKKHHDSTHVMFICKMRLTN